MSTNDDDASDTVDLDELERRLPSWTRELLRCLTLRRRQALVLREAGGMTFEEVSLRLRVTGARARQLHVAAVRTLDAAARRAVMLGRVAPQIAGPLATNEPRGIPDGITHVFDLSIEALNLSTRGEKCLGIAYIETVGQLVRKTDREILRIRNIGRKTLREIECALAKLGLHLGMRPSEPSPETKPHGRLRLHVVPALKGVHPDAGRGKSRE